MENNIIARFSLELPKTAKTLAKYVCKDDLRPMLKYVCIEPTRGLISATDAFKLQIINFEPIAGCPDGIQIFIDPKHITKVAGKRVNITVSDEGRGMRKAEIECNGELFTTETKTGEFPNILLYIPKKTYAEKIRLTSGSVDALRDICHLHKNNIGIVFEISEGCNIMTVCPNLEDYTDNRAVYYLELAEPAELTGQIGFNPQNLALCLEASNGVISIIDETRAVMFEGAADATLLMPIRVGCQTSEYLREMHDKRTIAATTFAEDSAKVLEQLKETAVSIWEHILNIYTESGKCVLTPGNYTSRDFENPYKAKCGELLVPDLDVKNINCGNIRLSVRSIDIFGMLATWESVIRCEKTIFSVGNVDEVTATVLEHNNGELFEKKTKLRVLGGGWYSPAKRGKNDYDAPIYYEVSGCIVYCCRLAVGIIDDATEFVKWSAGKAEKIPEQIRMRKADNKYFAALSERLGMTA